MTKQLEDLFKSFDNMTTEEQFVKIREVRDTRSIVRPSVAKKRHKKAHKKAEAQKDKARKLLAALSEQEKEELIKKLTGG